MKQTFLLTAGLLLAALHLNAQKISGLVKQPDGKVAEFATVTLHQAKDSTLVKGAITGTDGTYEMSGAAAGRYFLKSNLIGTGDAHTPAFDYDGGDKTVEPISLQVAANMLSLVIRVPPRSTASPTSPRASSSTAPR